MSHRAVKIIATIGPASSSEERMRALIAAGVNVFRFNFAHGTREEHADQIALVRKLAKEVNQPVGTLADISGPKIRLGELPGGSRELVKDETVTLSSSNQKGDVLPVALNGFDEYVRIGDPVYLADGTRKLTVTEIHGHDVRAVVEVGGTVSSAKGINLPNLRKPLPVVSKKDLLDVECALKAGVDWIGLSFVSAASDAESIRDLMGKLSLHRPVLAKLERRAVMEKLDEIVEAFDGVMVARGDLGIEVEFEKVPGIQDRILRVAREKGKPAIVATQILTSMINNPRPTRAEVTDIAHAVSSGADALMLSEETAIGSFAVESVQTIAKVACEVESEPLTDSFHMEEALVGEEPAVAHTAVILAHEINASAILCPTRSGNAARAVARFRPAMPIVVVSESEQVVGELTMFRGVCPQHLALGQSLEARVAASVHRARELGLALPGNKLVIVGGIPAGSGTTNLLLVHTVMQTNGSANLSSNQSTT